MGDRPVDADVVVVGGGPAGAAAAIACATRGLRVVLCEREQRRRDRPGETLHPGIEPLLAQLGITDRLADVIGARHPGIWVEWGSPRRFEPFGSDVGGQWQGFQVWRADFDALMRDRASEVGVMVRHRLSATGVLRDQEHVWGVQTDAGSIASRMVVDATGTARFLGRGLGIASPARSPRLIARYGYAEGSCPARDEAPALIGDASGWSWSARVRPNTYQWTRVCFDAPPTTEPPEELCRLTPLGRSRGADVTWRLAERTAGPGWFMVGDTAAMLDPASSHGVLKALLSGITAGHLIAASLAGKAPPDAIAAAYHDWVQGWFATDSRRLATFYRQLGAAGFG